MPNGNGSSISERARTSGAADPQDGLFDKQWESKDLEAALEERERIAEQRREVNRSFKDADAAVKGQLIDFELAVGEVARIGRFRIKKTATPPRDVAFSTEGGERLNIKVEGED